MARPLRGSRDQFLELPANRLRNGARLRHGFESRMRLPGPHGYEETFTRSSRSSTNASPSWTGGSVWPDRPVQSRAVSDPCARRALRPSSSGNVEVRRARPISGCPYSSRVFRHPHGVSLCFSGRHRDCGRPRLSRLRSRHTPPEPEKGIGRPVPTYYRVALQDGESSGRSQVRKSAIALPRGSQSEILPLHPGLLRPLATQGAAVPFLGDPVVAGSPSLPLASCACEDV